MRPENYEYAWYIRYRWYRCSSPAGIVQIWAASETEAQQEAADRLGTTDLQVEPADGEERFRFLCRATERELASGGPRMRSVRR